MLCTQSGLRRLCPSFVALSIVQNRGILCEEQLPLLHTILARHLPIKAFSLDQTVLNGLPACSANKDCSHRQKRDLFCRCSCWLCSQLELKLILMS